MSEVTSNPIESIRSKVEGIYRSKVLKVSPETAKAYSGTGSGQPGKELIEAEPLAEMRARTDGKNVAISYNIPHDRYTSFVLSLWDAAHDPVIGEKLVKGGFGFPTDIDHLMVVSRKEDGSLRMFVGAKGIELETRKDGESTAKGLEKDGFYEITDEMQSNSRILLKGKNGATVSIRIHDTKPHNLTEREQYLIAHEPKIRRIHNESWLNSKHIPTAYASDEYNPEIDGSALTFLKMNKQTTEGSKWVPFCPDRDKYWGIAARNPKESCIELEGLDVCIAISDKDGVEHRRMPLDMPRSLLSTEKVVYLEPEIDNKGRQAPTEGQTGLIHLGSDPQDGWYYVTQPIPKLKDGKVDGYFALIGREADLLPEKKEVLYKAFWESSAQKEN